jgi:DNA-binding transcriptional regulator LsrR (DeoR family)
VLGVPVLAEIPTHGQREKTVPASAMFTILLVIGLGVAVSAVIRGYFAPTASAAVMSVRSVAATVSAWTVKPQPQVGFIGLAGDDR